jgi:hypothetical protein
VRRTGQRKSNRPELAIVAACVAHAREVHGLELSRDQVLAVARPEDDS